MDKILMKNPKQLKKALELTKENILFTVNLDIKETQNNPNKNFVKTETQVQFGISWLKNGQEETLSSELGKRYNEVIFEEFQNFMEEEFDYHQKIENYIESLNFFKSIMPMGELIIPQEIVYGTVEKYIKTHITLRKSDFMEFLTKRIQKRISFTVNQ